MNFLRNLWNKIESASISHKAQSTSPEIILLEAGLTLKNRREQLGMSLRDLAIRTRITTPVLEAIESGWIHRLPEHAYLVSMLPLLESQLNLPKGSLEAVDRAAYLVGDKYQDNKLKPFTPGNIDILTTWQGSLIYIIAITGGLFLLNLQQRYIAESNSFSLNPLPVLYPLNQNANINNGDTSSSYMQETILSATRGKKNKWLDLSKEKPDFVYNNGTLKINLNKERSIYIKGSAGTNLSLKRVLGNVSVNLKPPILLKVNPPLKDNEIVYWNGIELKQLINKPGTYRFPIEPNNLQAPSFDLPNVLPLSP